MKRFGFIGLGNMGGAIARGLASGGAFALHGFDPSEGMCRKNADIMTIHPTVQELVNHSDYVLLAVKPQVMRPVLTGLASALGPETCLASIAAGVTLDQLVEWSGKKCPVVRVMPNTPAMVGKGVYALCFDHGLLDESRRQTLLDVFPPSVRPTSCRRSSSTPTPVSSVPGPPTSMPSWRGLSMRA